MTSEKQIRANRKNTLKSTGPRTTQGKLMVSSSALKHGLLSKDVVIKDESDDEFVQFRQKLYAELAPVGELEQLFADRVIASFWRLRRVGKIEIELLNNMSSFQLQKPEGKSSSDIPTMQLTKTYEDGRIEVVTTGSSLKAASDSEDIQDEMSLGQAVHADFAGPNTLGKFRRYEAHIDRTLYKALHELQRLQAARLGHKVAAPLAIDIDVTKSDV